MHFSKFYRYLNILFLVLLLKSFNICGQFSNSSSLIASQSPSSESSTVSLQNPNSTQDSDQIDIKNVTIFSNPWTENSVETDENKITTKFIESSDENIAEISHFSTTTTDSNLLYDITIENGFTDSQLINNSDILIIDSVLTQNNVQNVTQMLSTSRSQPISTTQEVPTEGSPQLYSTTKTSFSENIFDFETTTSTQLPTDDNISPQLAQNSSNDINDSYKNNFKNIENSLKMLNFETSTEVTPVFDEETTLFFKFEEHNDSLTTPQTISEVNIETKPQNYIMNKKELVENVQVGFPNKNIEKIGNFIQNNEEILVSNIESLKSTQNTSDETKVEITTSSEQIFTSNETQKESPNNSFKMMCIFGGWSAYRSGLGKFDVNDLTMDNIVVSNCSHLIYSFVALNADSEVISADPNRELNFYSGTFAKLNALKKNNHNLKVMIGVGGWDTSPNVWTFLLSNGTRRQKTIENIIAFVKSYSFDGVVISWFYPGVKLRGGHNSDKLNLVNFLQELKSYINTLPIELAIMGPAFKQDIDDGFNIPKISSSVDYVLLMSYDYFGSWDSNVNHLAPLYPSSNASNQMNVNFTLHYWLNKGIDPSKIVLGLTTYGRSFTLADPKNYQINSKSIGPGVSGPYTNRPGIIGYNEICEIFLSTSGVKLGEDMHRVTPFVHFYDQWIGFEDELSIFIKTKYALDNKLKGIFFWTLDLDDFHNKCGWGHFPLIQASLQAIQQKKPF